jgi:uncharacterized membrane protein
MELAPVQFQQTRQGVRDLDQWKKPPFPASGGPVPPAFIPNVGDGERLFSLLGGAAIAGAGLAQRSFSGILLGLLGAALVQRGMTGHCRLYEYLGVNHANPARTPQEMAYVCEN